MSQSSYHLDKKIIQSAEIVKILWCFSENQTQPQYIDFMPSNHAQKGSFFVPEVLLRKPVGLCRMYLYQYNLSGLDPRDEKKKDKFSDKHRRIGEKTWVKNC